MAATLREAGLQSCKADPDVWMREAVKDNGDLYWEYVLVYVDDVLAISHDPRKRIMDYLEEKYTLKNGTVQKPDAYLGADVKEHHIGGLESGMKPRWAMSSDTYVKRAVADVERALDEPQCQTSTVRRLMILQNLMQRGSINSRVSSGF